jgi:hypothetical protein
LRVIIVAEQEGAVKKYICSSSGGAREKKERQDETQFTTKKFCGKTNSGLNPVISFWYSFHSQLRI